MVLVFHQGTGLQEGQKGEGRLVPVCVCALFIGHIGYISLKTKNIFFFIIKVFAKTRNTKKKKKNQFQLCTPRLRCFCASRAFTPRLGSFYGPHQGSLCLGGVLLRPPNLKVTPANIQQVISAHLALGEGGGGQGPSTDPSVSAETDTPQVRYQVLKLRGFSLFQSQLRTRVKSTKQSLLPVCVCVCSWEPAFYSTLDLNQGTDVEVESWSEWEDGWLGQRASLRCAPDFSAQHQHWEPTPLPHPSPALLPTCLVLEIGCSLYFFSKSHGLKGNWSSSKRCFSIMDRTRVQGRIWISKSLFKKTKAWVEYAHASSYTVYNQEYVKAVCVYMTRSLCFPLSLSPSPPCPGFSPYPVYPPQHYISQKTRS